MTKPSTTLLPTLLNSFAAVSPSLSAFAHASGAPLVDPLLPPAASLRMPPRAFNQSDLSKLRLLMQPALTQPTAQPLDLTRDVNAPAHPPAHVTDPEAIKQEAAGGCAIL
jgi:hypothetical protein